MTGRTKFILTLSAIFLGIIFAQIYSLIFHPDIERTETSLINQYYRIGHKRPAAEKTSLDYIVSKYPDNVTAAKELAFWYLRNNQPKDALNQFKKVLALNPNDKDAPREISLLSNIDNEGDGVVYSNTTLRNINKFISAYLMMPTAKATVDTPTEKTEKGGASVAAPVMSERDSLLNAFYNNKKQHHNSEAWKALKSLLARYPTDVVALKEAGYFALADNNNALAFHYFKKVYELTHDPYIALQNGYILNNMGENKLAYHYFELATNNPNLDERMRAELALTNLRAIPFKFIPDPYYAEIYYDPFYQSRFKLLVHSLVVRVGKVLNYDYNWQIYLGYRRTMDNKSGTSGPISSIFNDNAAITSIGTSITPFRGIPFVAFIEGGKAVDLVYQNRARWRNDFRTGLAYYNEWGNESRYTFTPTFHIHLKNDIYADAIYYSRYINTIATARVRPGFEFFRYKTTSLSLYLKGNIIEDKRREFFNNLIEYGPGIVFTPSDRYNVSLRYESLNGHYLPAGSPSPNPYSLNYHNGITQLDVYFRF